MTDWLVISNRELENGTAIRHIETEHHLRGPGRHPRTEIQIHGEGTAVAHRTTVKLPWVLPRKAVLGDAFTGGPRLQNHLRGAEGPCWPLVCWPLGVPGVILCRGHHLAGVLGVWYWGRCTGCKSESFGRRAQLSAGRFCVYSLVVPKIQSMLHGGN